MIDSGPPPVYGENEPNDFAITANHLGTVSPGGHLFVEGVISDIPFDEADGFSLIASQPLEIEFNLFLDDPFSDLDLLVWDPVVFDFVASFENDGPESGSFTVLDGGAEFHMVVVPFQNLNGPYTLEIIAHPVLLLNSVGGGDAIDGPEKSAPDRAELRVERRRYFEDQAGDAAAPAPIVEADPDGVLVRQDPETGELSFEPVSTGD